MDNLTETPCHTLTNDEIKRYSRQIILNELGPTGQEQLKNSRVLIVGAGGLGCPLAIQLAAAGIGHIGIVDYDVVEISNLHRQFLHHEKDAGFLNKAQSICNAIKDYDVIADCTDNVASRYLLNDVCVLNFKPLVSGSALRWEGQLTIYNYKDGPCYRCIFPKPPPLNTVTNCSEGGVFGVIPSIIGNLQALEIIKIVLKLSVVFSGKMLLFDGLELKFRTIQLRTKQKQCQICSEDATIKELIDYEMFCGLSATDKTNSINLIEDCYRITATDLAENIKNNISSLVLIDVRSEVEFQISHIKNSLNIPINQFARKDQLTCVIERVSTVESCYFICRRGNDSQQALQLTKNELKDKNKNVNLFDVIGGLESWSNQVDNNFPLY